MNDFQKRMQQTTRRDNELIGSLLILRSVLDGEDVSLPSIRQAVKVLAARQPGDISKEAKRQARLLC